MPTTRHPTGVLAPFRHRGRRKGLAELSPQKAGSIPASPEQSSRSRPASSAAGRLIWGSSANGRASGPHSPTWCRFESGLSHHRDCGDTMSAHVLWYLGIGYPSPCKRHVHPEIARMGFVRNRDQYASVRGGLIIFSRRLRGSQPRGCTRSGMPTGSMISFLFPHPSPADAGHMGR